MLCNQTLVQSSCDFFCGYKLDFVSLIKIADKIFDKLVKNFKKTFFSFDIKELARGEILQLVQKLFKNPNKTTNDGFKKHITTFQNVVFKMKFEDKIIAINYFFHHHQPLCYQGCGC